MTRRIALSVIALVAVLLSAVAVPLGLLTAHQFRHDFTDETVAAAATLNSDTEEHLDDSESMGALNHSIARLARAGDQISIYDRQGRRITGSRTRPVTDAATVRQALTGAPSVSYVHDDRMRVIAPVFSDAGRGLVGFVVLSRSTVLLDRHIVVIWTWLIAVSVGGLVAAGLIATALARWVSRPLGALQSATQRLGTGELDARSPVGAGPHEVRRLAANFNQMAARLEALVAGHQAMMADVSHQIRTPLTALRLRLDVLADEGQDQFGPELAGAQDEVIRLSRIVDGLLAVARAENVAAHPVSVRVDTVIRDRAAAWQPAAAEKSVTLATVAVEAAIARLAEGQLEQILDNLFANALDAVPAGGRIQVGAGLTDQRVLIVVADNGPGMTPEQQRLAFSRFVTTTPGGTGLGLAIVHRLITSAGGSVELSDTTGGGLTVTLELPATASAADRAIRRPGTAAAAWEVN